MKKTNMKSAWALSVILMSFFSLQASASELVAHYAKSITSGKIKWHAEVKTMRPWTGFEASTLEIRYQNSYGNTICGDTNVGRTPLDVSIVLIVGQGESAKSYSFPAYVDCYYMHYTPTAIVSISEHAYPELWNKIFPMTGNGERWYALQVAAVQAGTNWVSNYGQNFSLILEKQ